jgi:hypothetical protein
MPTERYYQDMDFHVGALYESGRRINSNMPVVGREWYLNASTGAATADGRSVSNSKLTMADIFDELTSGDVVYIVGKLREQLTAPAGIFGVKIIGLSSQRHPDAHTSNNGFVASAWLAPASPTATTPLVLVRQQGWEFHNILFDGPSDAAAIQLFRDGGSGDDERDASHAIISNCKFVAGQNHIELKGGLSQVVLKGNLFFGATADSILETVGAGIGTNNYFRIIGNHWHNNASHIDVGLNYATITGNTFGAASGDKVDLRTGSENMVWGNALYGTYSNAGGYYAGTNDEWGGNFNSLSGGVTAADPA